MKEINVWNDCEVHWFGQISFKINLMMSNHTVKLIYVGEPPHGDSYNELYIDDKKMDGYVWGCNFIFPFSQQYIICSWMEDKIERQTIIIDIASLKYIVMDEYWYNYEVKNDEIIFLSAVNVDKLALAKEDIIKLFQE